MCSARGGCSQASRSPSSSGARTWCGKRPTAGPSSTWPGRSRGRTARRTVRPWCPSSSSCSGPSCCRSGAVGCGGSRGAARRDRCARSSWTYPVLLVAVFAGAGKSYYVAPVLLVYLAAGCVVVDRWMKSSGRVMAVGALVAVSAATSAIITLPLLSARDVGDSPVAALNDDALETIGWPQLVDEVAATLRVLPPAQQRTAILFASNYGEAGAIDHLGGSAGLPRAYSGHNSYSDWGIPPDDAAPVIVIGYSQRGYVDAHWTGCEEAARRRQRPRGRQRGARGADLGLRRACAPVERDVGRPDRVRVGPATPPSRHLPLRARSRRARCDARTPRSCGRGSSAGSATDRRATCAAPSGSDHRARAPG